LFTFTETRDINSLTSLSAENYFGTGELKYLACHRTICYPPVSVPIKWRLQVIPFDLRRSPKAIQHRELFGIRWDLFFREEKFRSDVVYVSKSRIERGRGPLRIAHLPGESRPVIYSVHGAIAEHFKMDSAKLKESHSSTIEHQNAATEGGTVTKCGYKLQCCKTLAAERWQSG